MFRRSLVVFALLAAFSAAASAATIDTTTQGNWIGKYGNDGYILLNYAGPPAGGGPALLANDVVSPPSFLTSYSYSANAKDYAWDIGGSSIRYLQDPANISGPRNATTVYDDGDWSMNLNVNATKLVRLSVYGLDFEPQARSIRVDVDGNLSDVVLFNNATPANAYYNGEWGSFLVNLTAGTHTINVHQLGGANLTLGAVTFDVLPEPSSLVMAALGTVGLGLAAWRKRRSA